VIETRSKDSVASLHDRHIAAGQRLDAAAGKPDEFCAAWRHLGLGRMRRPKLADTTSTPFHAVGRTDVHTPMQPALRGTLGTRGVPACYIIFRGIAVLRRRGWRHAAANSANTAVSCLVGVAGVAASDFSLHEVRRPQKIRT